jgi:HEAT repeat protein
VENLDENRNLDHLLEALTSGDEQRARAAVKQIPAYGPQAVEKLVKLLEVDDSETRWWAIWALAEIKDPRVPPLLVKKLDDPQASVRQCAALGLRQQPSPESIPYLVEALKSSDPILARLAGGALEAAGKAATPALIKVLETAPQSARLEALRALAGIGDTSSIPALFKAFENDSALAEYWANEGLDRMGVGMNFFKT